MEEKTLRIPRHIIDVVDQDAADDLLERQWRKRIALKKSQRQLEWLDKESEPGSWAKEMRRRGRNMKIDPVE